MVKTATRTDIQSPTEKRDFLQGEDAVIDPELILHSDSARDVWHRRSCSPGALGRTRNGQALDVL